jgi:glycosyltransferase involved in cell wall biosynthesis
MQAPQVSVLMPTWNAGQYVAEAVESVLSQSFKDFEVLIIDGGSTDQTLAILSGFRDPRLRVLPAPSAGIVAALNFGLEQARAPWIARQDADDVSLPRRLETQWQALNGDAHAILSHTDVEFIGEGSAAAGRARFPRTQALMALRLCFQCAIVHSTVMFKKEAALAAGGYREPQAEDYALWGRLIESGRFIGLPQKLLKFRIHPGSASSRNREPMVALAETIAVEHCRRFMRLSAEEAKRAHAVLKDRGNRNWAHWKWFLSHCVPRLRWKSAEAYAWLGLQTLKMLR